MRVACRAGFCTVASLALAACAAAPPAAAPPPAAEAQAEPPLDASFDWHVLLPAPLGTLLRDMPLKLHEVLLFHDRMGVGAAVAPGVRDQSDCHAPDAGAPHFADHSPEEYLMCFLHDRLARIDAKVPLDAGGGNAARLFERICAGWGAIEAPAAAAPAEPACAGREDGVAWSARLLIDSSTEPAGAVLSVTLTLADDQRPPDGEPVPAAGPP